MVVARAACNQRLVDACYLWAFAALTASPGARRCYDAHRARGATHHQALRALGNRLVGILHGCLAHRIAYQEQVAWPAAEPPPDHKSGGVPGGCNPPAILATRLARGPVVQLGQRCREVKRDGTAGLVGCWIKAAAEGGTTQPTSLAACLDRA